ARAPSTLFPHPPLLRCRCRAGAAGRDRPGPDDRRPHGARYAGGTLHRRDRAAAATTLIGAPGALAWLPPRGILPERPDATGPVRSEEHTSALQSRENLV